MRHLFAAGVLVGAVVTPATAADTAEPDRAIACSSYGNLYSGPNRKAETIAHLIDRTERIVLGFVVGERPAEDRWTGTDVVFKVQIESTIKGEDGPADPIELTGVRREHLYPIDPYLLDLTYRHSFHLATAETVYLAGYTDSLFGVEIRTKPKAKAPCEHVPALEVGMTYLMFLGGAVTEVSFEPIVNFQDDPWLKRVKQAVQKHEFEDLTGKR